MSTPAIEARSLSSLTALASNPPAYPRNPTHIRNDPLVLYIARVPGSKGTAVLHMQWVYSDHGPDVFLSPMKPRQKVVTVEDITSSLYFLHVEQPEDANLVRPPQFQEPNYQEQRAPGSNYPPVPTVQRKAVPGTDSLPARKPVSGTLAPIENYGNRQNVSARTYSRQSGLLAPDLTPRQSYDGFRYQGENQRPSNSPQRSPERARPAGTSLTLIRRDPASGAQWNVARIEDPSIAEISSSTLNESAAKRKIGAPMYIDVTNPGYSKFLQTERCGTPALSGRPSENLVRPDQRGVPPQFHMPVPIPENQANSSSNVFRRRLWMEGSQYANGSFGYRKNSSFDFNSGRRPDSRDSYDARTNGYSFDDRPAPSPSFLTRDDQTYGTIPVSDRQTSFRGYVFTSPWNGRCEFTTGAGGGSLKVSVFLT
jgi:hypothetical protein